MPLWPGSAAKPYFATLRDPHGDGTEDNGFLQAAAIAGVYVALGEHGSAIAWLHRALDLAIPFSST